MSTWALRLAADRKRLCLWFTIQGIEPVFLERDIDASTILGATRTELVNIVAGSLEVGQEEIDLDHLCHKGGSFRVRIRQRKDSTTLDDLFQTRKRRQTSITAAINKTDTTVAVGDSTWAAADTGVIYLGAETVRHTTRPTSTSFGGLTRGMFGSRAQLHKGSGDWRGTAVYDVPPFWLGRRVTLKASFLDDAGNTNAAKTTTIGTFTINEDPRQVDALTWELSAGPLSDEYAKRELYTGLRDASGAGTITRYANTSPYYVVPVDEAGTFLPSPSGFVTYALTYFDDVLHGMARVIARDIVSTPNTVRVLPDDYFSPSLWSFGLSSGQFFTIEKTRHIALISGLPVSSLLPALCSELGDGANGAYDLLPGVAAASYGLDGWQMGAGIHEDDIDDAAFMALPTYGNWCYILDKTVNVGDLLGEWALFSGCFWYVTAAGLLSAQQQSETTAQSVMTFGASVIVGDTPVTTKVEESSIYPVIEIVTNYDPAEQAYKLTQVFQDGEMMRRYSQRHDVRRIEAKGISVDRHVPMEQQFLHPAKLTEEQAKQTARGWQKSEGRGRLIVTCTTRLKGLRASLGDVVTIGFDGNDYEGGTINGREARVIARRPRFQDGRVDFVLQVLEPLYLFAPSGVITAVSTTSIANDTVTLSTTAPDVASTSPTSDFVAGQTVRRWDVSAGTSEVLTIASIPNATQLVFTAGVTGTVETGVDWLTWNTLGTNTSAGDTANGQNEGDWDYLMDDDAVPAAGGVRRWR
jgi:hypothetical protein